MSGFNVDDWLINGELRAYTDVGGYPVLYLDGGMTVLCPACADEEENRVNLVQAGANWEDPDLYCEQCCSRIPSAYAEPDDEPDDTPNSPADNEEEEGVSL